MNICDLISVRETPQSVDLAAIGELLQALHEGADGLSLDVAGDLQQIVVEYVPPPAEGADVAGQLLDDIVANGQGGMAALVRGAQGTGKSHLLALLALLLRQQPARKSFVNSHPSYEGLQQRLAGREYVVVPLPLAEHHAHDEHLEDIVFDRTEYVLSSYAYDTDVVLSEQSYALDLVQRHITPRYSEELDEYTAEREDDVESWQSLREDRPGRAVEIARQFARHVEYPLDFRQSRVERISKLLEVIDERNFDGVVWLVDDLTRFLASLGPKAVHSDCAFLDFIGQRCKIAPLYLVATVTETLDHLTGVESYLLNAIQSSFRTDLILDTEHTRTVARQRAIVAEDEQQYEQAIAGVCEAYRAAFSDIAFNRQELAEAYPLHPVALESLESIAERFFGAADTVMKFIQDLLNDTHLAGLLERDFRQLIGGVELFDYLRPRIAAHPEASAYIHDVLDYYDRNADEVFEAEPQLCLALAKLLILFRLANIEAPVSLMVELLGLDASSDPLFEREAVSEAVDAMRLSSPFVDTRGGDSEGEPVYYITAHTSVNESLRRRITAIKASLSETDDRLWQAAISACGETGLPLSELDERRTLEVQWENTYRCISAQVCDLRQLDGRDVAGYIDELGDPATIEDIFLLIAPPGAVEQQRRAWREPVESVRESRWAAGVVAWIPAEFTSEQLEEIKELAAVGDLLQRRDEGGGGNSTVAEQLSQMHASLSGRVRQAISSAYHGGVAVPLRGEPIDAGELAMVRGDWEATVRAIVTEPLRKVFPDFEEIAPRRSLVSREQIDTLIDDVIRPGRVELGDDDARAELVEAFLKPPGLVTIDGDTVEVSVSDSDVASEVLERIDRRDRKAQEGAGRPIACADLAQHLVKSRLGVPAELFELIISALIRTGHLAAVGDDNRMRGLQQIQTPLSKSVEYVARPPLLDHGDWQKLGRICRIALDVSVPAPDRAVQQAVWERLLRKREEYVQRVRRLREQLQPHIEKLEQRPSQWQQILSDLDAVEDLFSAADPELHSAIGLQNFVDATGAAVDKAEHTSELLGVFRRIDELAEYLDELADGIVKVREYLLSDELKLEGHKELQQRRQAVLSAIDGGEQLLNDELNLRRLTQMFLGSYRRIYVSWHNRMYRSPVFDRYRTIEQSSEMRALKQLSKLHVDVEVTADDMVHRVQQQAARRCEQSNLSEVLQETPVCPNCHLRLNEEPQLVDGEELVEEIKQAVKGYLAALLTPSNRGKLREYAQAASGHGEAPAHLHKIAGLDTDASARQVLSLFTDAAISHINRALAGKRIKRRNFGQLQKALQGRTLTKKEAHDLFIQWLQDGEEDGDAQDLLRIDG